MGRPHVPRPGSSGSTCKRGDKMTTGHVADVAELYDSPGGQIGPLLFGNHMHWGYWDAGTAEATFAEAADRLADLMIERARIGAGERFVDLGCGVGQAALRLALATGCRVDGITISGYQQRTATAMAEAKGMQDILRFIHGNALAIPSEGGAYDGGWFFESIFHMGHREALREAGRVLKPGATLVLTDLPTLPHTTDDFRAFVDEHIHSRFIKAEDYPAILDEAGFDLVKIDDVTANVMPWLVSKLQDALTANRDAVVERFGEATDKAIDDWLYVFEYMSENLGYILVTARKR